MPKKEMSIIRLIYRSADEYAAFRIRRTLVERGHRVRLDDGWGQRAPLGHNEVPVVLGRAALEAREADAKPRLARLLEEAHAAAVIEHPPGDEVWCDDLERAIERRRARPAHDTTPVRASPFEDADEQTDVDALEIVARRKTGGHWAVARAPEGTRPLEQRTQVVRLLQSSELGTIHEAWDDLRKLCLPDFVHADKQRTPYHQFLSDIAFVADRDGPFQARNTVRPGCANDGRARVKLGVFARWLAEDLAGANRPIPQGLAQLIRQAAIDVPGMSHRPAMVRVDGEKTSFAMAEVPLARAHYRTLLELDPDADDERERMALLDAFLPGDEAAFARLAAVLDRRVRQGPNGLPAWRRVSSSVEREPALALDRCEWFTAVAVCNLVSRHDGLDPVYTIQSREGSAFVERRMDANGYRLPTEREWTIAAEPARFLGVDDERLPIGWFVQPHARVVGETRPSRHGIFDIGGHVLEWCDPERAVPIEVGASLVVMRGVPYSEAPPATAEDSRWRLDPAAWSIVGGIRLVRDLP